MDQNTIDAVKEVVAEITAKNEIFSAFDVTRRLRNIKGLSVFHSEVRRLVHEMYGDMELPMDYTRSDFVLPNGRNTIIYHSSSVDSTSYDPNKIGGDNDSSPFVAQAAPIQTTQTTQTTQTATPTQQTVKVSS